VLEAYDLTGRDEAQQRLVNACVGESIRASGFSDITPPMRLIISQNFHDGFLNLAKAIARWLLARADYGNVAGTKLLKDSTKSSFIKPSPCKTY
jgi:hypothetical protein